MSDDDNKENGNHPNQYIRNLSDFALEFMSIVEMTLDVNEMPVNPYPYAYLPDGLLLQMVDNAIMDRVLEESENSVNHMPRNSDREIDIVPVLFNTLETEFTDCSICQDDFEQASSVIMLNCNHLFHNKCISEWVKYKTSCPICRETVGTKT